MSLQPEAVAYHTDRTGSSYFFGAGAGPSPSASVVLNNADLVSIPQAVYTLVKNIPQTIATVAIPVNYGTSPLSVIPYAQLLATTFTLKSTTTPVTGDLVTITVSVSDGLTTTTLYPPSEINGTALANFTTIPIVALGFLGSHAQGNYTFTFRMSVVYTSTGSSPFNLTVSQFPVGANIVAGVKTF